MLVLGVAYARCSRDARFAEPPSNAPRSSATTSPESSSPTPMTDAMPTNANEPPDWNLPEAFFEAGIVTSFSEAELRKYLSPRVLAGLITPVHCGSQAACDAVRAFITDAEHTKPEIMTAERWTLPPKERMAVASPDLSEEERLRVHTMQNVFVVRLGGSKGSAPDHLVARAGFALSAALAEVARGFVHDEVRQRIESPAVARSRCITANLGDRFDPSGQITLQALPHAEKAGNPSFRLTTHGMKRFGAPDLEVVCSEEELPEAGHLVNALASALAHAKAPKRAVVFSPSDGNDLSVTLSRAPLAEAQPLNVVLRAALSPKGFAAPRGSWTDAASTDDRRKARQILEQASKKGGVRGLMVRADFATDAGIEAMWVELASLEGDVGTGTLKSQPTISTHLKEGSVVRVPLDSVDKVLGASPQE